MIFIIFISFYFLSFNKTTILKFNFPKYFLKYYSNILGIVISNLVPILYFEYNFISVPSVLLIDFNRLNPIPLPLIFLPLTSALLKNLSKIRPISSSLIPIPLSRTIIFIFLFTYSKDRLILPPFSVYLNAFSISIISILFTLL